MNATPQVKINGVPLRRVRWTFDYEHVYDGWTDNTRWNGFLNVHVSEETHKAVIAAMDLDGGSLDEQQAIADFKGLPSFKADDGTVLISYSYGYTSVEVKACENCGGQPKGEDGAVCDVCEGTGVVEPDGDDLDDIIDELTGKTPEREEADRLLDEFSTLALRLSAAWEKLNGTDDGEFAVGYPSCLPSFDEFANNLSAWRNHEAEVPLRMYHDKGVERWSCADCVTKPDAVKDASEWVEEPNVEQVSREFTPSSGPLYCGYCGRFAMHPSRNIDDATI